MLSSNRNKVFQLPACGAPAMISMVIRFFFPFTPKPQVTSRHHLCNHTLNASAHVRLRVSERSSKAIAKLGLHTSLRLQDDQQHSCLFTATCTKKGHCFTVELHLHSWKLKENLTCEQNWLVYIKTRPSKYYVFCICLFSKPAFRDTLLLLNINKKNPGVKLPFFLLPL